MKASLKFLITCALLLGATGLAKADDYTFKFIFTKTDSTRINIAGDPSCGVEGYSKSVAKTVVDSSVTQAYIKVFKKNGDRTTPYKTSGTITVTPGTNFSYVNGEFTYTLTGITATNDDLVAWVYKNGNGTGSPYDSTDFSISTVTAASSRPSAGYVDVGDVDAVTGSLSVAGVISSATAADYAGYTVVTINIPDQGGTSYVPMITVANTSGSGMSNTSRIFVPVVFDVAATSFKVYIEETTSVVQYLRLNVVLLKY